MNKPLHYTKLVLKKRQMFKFWKDSGVKVWQSYFKEEIELMTLRKTDKRFFLNSDRRRYVVEGIRKTPTQKTPTWKIPPIKLQPGKFPPGKFSPRKFPPGIFPPIFLNIPTRISKSFIFSLFPTSSLILLIILLKRCWGQKFRSWCTKKIVACWPKFDIRSLL